MPNPLESSAPSNQRAKKPQPMTPRTLVRRTLAAFCIAALPLTVSAANSTPLAQSLTSLQALAPTAN